MITVGTVGTVTLDDPDLIVKNGGSAVAAVIVTGDNGDDTVNVRVFLNGPDTVRIQYVPIGSVVVTTPAPAPVAAPAPTPVAGVVTSPVDVLAGIDPVVPSVN